MGCCWEIQACRPDEPSLWGAGVPGAWGKLLCTFFESIERAVVSLNKNHIGCGG